MIFDQSIFILFSIMLSGLPSEKSIFHLDGNFLRKNAPDDLQYIYLPMKVPKT